MPSLSRQQNRILTYVNGALHQVHTKKHILPLISSYFPLTATPEFFPLIMEDKWYMLNVTHNFIPRSTQRVTEIEGNQQRNQNIAYATVPRIHCIGFEFQDAAISLALPASLQYSRATRAQRRGVQCVELYG